MKITGLTTSRLLLVLAALAALPATPVALTIAVLVVLVVALRTAARHHIDNRLGPGPVAGP